MKFLYTVLILSALMLQSNAQHTWTVLIYMRPGDFAAEGGNLCKAAWKNINDLMRAQLDDNVALLVQLHAVDNTAWRYRIHHGTLKLESIVTVSQNYTNDIYDAAHWAFGLHDAQYNGLIFWGHGSGILIPFWNDASNRWELEEDDALYSCESCLVKKSAHTKNNHRLHRSILMDANDKSSITHTNMTHILRLIKKQILGKKLDFIAMDTCLGASIEHAVQVAPYTNYFVACQNCQEHDGLEYNGLANRLLQQEATPENVTSGIVEDYHNYYKHRLPKTENYTLSAIDCSKISVVKEQLDIICKQLLGCMQQSEEITILLNAILQQYCPHFCFVPMYTDLYTVLYTIEQSLATNYCWKVLPFEQLVELQTSLKQTKKELKSTVIANSTGNNMVNAHGLSIYWPFSHIDSSYYSCDFAKTSAWLAFLETVVPSHL